MFACFLGGLFCCFVLLFHISSIESSDKKLNQCNGEKNNINTGEHTTITQKINVILDDVSLERVNSTKFLGVIIDENLTWKHHIDAISKTISRNIGMLTKLKHYVTGYILYSLYCTLVLLYVNYGILIHTKST